VAGAGRVRDGSPGRVRLALGCFPSLGPGLGTLRGRSPPAWRWPGGLTIGGFRVALRGTVSPPLKLIVSLPTTF
jgi:hypothetical protein